MRITRRELMATAAAAAAAQAARMPGDIVERHDAAVEALLQRQITDPEHRWVGGYTDDTGLCEPHSAGGLLHNLAGAVLCPQSKFHRSAVLMDRMKLAARHIERRQTPDGNIDLLITNFNSPPDSGFLVHNVASAACLAKRHDGRELSALIEPCLKRAAIGLAEGGVHTPNHRWVVSAALAQIHEVYPDPRYLRRIDQWLAEGIDIDKDGQYTERSTTVYNAICDRCFVVLADKLKRPELLDPVRRNLDSMLYLLHPGYEVVTEISRRQDLNQRGTMAPYWFSLAYLAAHDRNGRYATLVRHFAPQAAHLPAIMEYPELASPGPEPAPVPDDYEKRYPELDVVRFRRGLTSATILLTGRDRFFTLRRGDAVINAVRFASAFFGKGHFVPARAERRGATWQLTQSLQAGYYQPIDPAHRVEPGEWGASRGERRESQICRLEQSATIAETPSGFRVRVTGQGTKEVPVAIEINLREGGKLEGCVPAPKVDDGWILPERRAVYRVGANAIRFGPGAAPHRYTQVRGAQPKLPGPSVYITGFTPFDHTLEFEWG